MKTICLLGNIFRSTPATYSPPTNLTTPTENTVNGHKDTGSLHHFNKSYWFLWSNLKTSPFKTVKQKQQKKPNPAISFYDVKPSGKEEKINKTT